MFSLMVLGIMRRIYRNGTLCQGFLGLVSTKHQTPYFWLLGLTWIDDLAAKGDAQSAPFFETSSIWNKDVMPEPSTGLMS